MTVSELKELLEKILEKHGDIPCCFRKKHFGVCEINAVRMGHAFIEEALFFTDEYGANDGLWMRTVDDWEEKK